MRVDLGRWWPFRTAAGAQTGSGVTALVMTPDGRRVITGGRDGALRVWNPRLWTMDGRPIQTQSLIVTSIAVTPDGSRVVAGGQGVLGVWDLATRAPVGRPLAVGSAIGAQGIPYSLYAQLTPDGSRIATGSGDGYVRTYELDGLAEVGRPVRAHELVAQLGITPDGRTLITTGSDDGNDGMLRFWDLETGVAASDPIVAHRGFVNGVAVTPDGARVITAGIDGRVCLWGPDGTRIPGGGPIPAHDGWISDVAVTPDGTRAVTAGRRSLHVWRLSEPLSQGTAIPTDLRDIKALALTPDGTRAAFGDRLTGRLAVRRLP